MQACIRPQISICCQPLSGNFTFSLSLHCYHKDFSQDHRQNQRFPNMTDNTIEKAVTRSGVDTRSCVQGDNEVLANPMGKLIEHSHDADEAMKAFAGHEGEIIEIDDATNKRLLRIIDWNLLPLSTLSSQATCSYNLLTLRQCA